MGRVHGACAAALVASACARTGTAGIPSTTDAATEETPGPTLDAAVDTGAETQPTPVDASTTDAGDSLAPVSCASLPLCDDFESAAVGGPPNPMLWTLVSPSCSGAGKLAVDGSQAHSGVHSVRVDGGGGYCDHVFFANASVMPALGKQVYARLWVRLATALGGGHVSFLAMKDTTDNDNDVRMGGQDMVLMYNRQSDDATLPVMSPAGTAKSLPLAAQTWTCIEFHFDESAGTIDTWVDGTEVAGLVEDGAPIADVSTQWLARAGWKPSLADFKLGWESYSGQAITLWFDDVALAAQRIGCGS